MKNTNALQLTVIIIGLIFGFFSIQYCLSVLLNLIAWISDGMTGGVYMQSILSILLMMALNAIACWILITRSAGIVSYIINKSETTFDFKIISKPNQLLYLLIIIVGLFLFVKSLPAFLQAIYYAFKEKAGGNSILDEEYGANKARMYNWFILIMDILLPVVLLAYAKNIVDFFVKKIQPEESITLEQDIENISPDN